MTDSNINLELGDRHIIAQSGLTKREWFAGQAMAGILSVYGRIADEDTAADIAIEARWCADALLAELANRNTE